MESGSAPFLTALEIQEHFGVKPATVRKWVSRGLLEASGPWTAGGAHSYYIEDVARVKHDVAERAAKRRAAAQKTPQWFPMNLAPAHKVPSSEYGSLVTGPEAAKLLEVAPSTIRMWVTRGKLRPSGRLGAKHLYRLGDVVKMRPPDARPDASV